jgi:hypothetical protein
MEAMATVQTSYLTSTASEWPCLFSPARPCYSTKSIFTEEIFVEGSAHVASRVLVDGNAMFCKAVGSGGGGQIREAIHTLHGIGTIWGDGKASNVVIDEQDDALGVAGLKAG